MDSRLGFLLGLGMVATPAAADPVVTGHFDLGGSFTAFEDCCGGSFDGRNAEGAARINVAFGETWNVLFDIAAAGQALTSFPYDGYAFAQTKPSLHAWHGGESYAVGLLAGAEFGGFFDSFAKGFVGVEAEVYLGGHTAIGGQFVHYRAFDNDCCDIGYSTTRVWIDHYFSPDLLAGLSAASYAGDALFVSDSWSVTGSLEKRHTGTPFGGFLSVSYTANPDFETSETTGLIGVRIFADAPGSTLYSHNMATPFDTIRTPSVTIFSCFVAATRVLMADGTTKAIAEIRAGDAVIGEGGAVNTVLGIETPPLGARRLHAFNKGPAFVTAEHPFMTRDGWRSIDPRMTAAEVPGLAVQSLAVGHDVTVLAAVSATEREIAQAVGACASTQVTDVAVETAFSALHTITPHPGDPRTVVYNLMLDGNHTYFADGYLVHNKA